MFAQLRGNGQKQWVVAMTEQAAPNQIDTACDLMKAGRQQEAAARIAAFLKQHPDDERAWHMLSFALSDPDQQAYALQRVLRVNPDNRAARSQLTRLLQGAPAGGVSPARELPASLAVQPAAPAAAIPFKERGRGAWRIARYVAVKAGILFLTVAVGLFLATLLINYGGFVDQIFEANIDEALAGMARGLNDVPVEEIPGILEQARLSMEDAYGLNDPFLLRCFRWFVRGLTLQWGDAERLQTVVTRDSSVRAIIMERLPNSLLLLGAGNLVLFVASLLLALSLSKKYGSLTDRIMIGLAPLSAAPAWVHGIILTVIFAVHLHLLPFGGMFDETPPTMPLGYALGVAKHMILPVAAIFMATFFQSVYAWRTFFVLHSREDYVEMAEAKGLPSRMVERRYILRPALPYILTSLALVLITSWQGLLVLEMFFHWPGIGQLFVEAVTRIDRPVLVALIVLFAYLLAFTVFLLDLVYAVVDPRVRIEGQNRTLSAPIHRKRSLWRRSRRSRSAPQVAAGRREGSGRRAWQAAPRGAGKSLNRFAASLKSTFLDLARYPSAILGLLLILALVAMSIFAVVTIPLEEAISLSRGAHEGWYQAPKLAQPAWVNLFRTQDLPPTIVLDSSQDAVSKVVEVVSEDMTQISLTFPVDYAYVALPQDLLVFLHSDYAQKHPHIIFTWVTPDGRQNEFATFSLEGSSQTYYLSADDRFERKLGGQKPVVALFVPPDAATDEALPGRYELRVDAFVFEEGADLDARLVIEGRVYGLAGTDLYRRDLTVPLLWGTPVALTFGLLGAVGTALASLIIAAVGTWLGGWVDGLIQRVTEVNMILPTLPIAIMVYLV